MHNIGAQYRREAGRSSSHPLPLASPILSIRPEEGHRVSDEGSANLEKDAKAFAEPAHSW